MGDRKPPADRRQAIISAGSEIVGPATAAGAGMLLGGPAGAVAGVAAAGPATRALRSVLGELAGRVLGRREEMRAGAVLLAAQEEIEAQLAAGRALRGDGFLRQDTTGPASEVAEAAVLAAQRDPQAAKAPLLGKMLGRIQFEPEIDSDFAQHLVKQAEEITYRQLCCLALFNLNTRDRYALPDTTQILSGLTGALDPRVGLLQEIVDLHRRTMLQQRAADHPGTDIILNTATLNPARQELVGVGGWLSVLMDLPTAIAASELESLATTLRTLASTSPGLPDSV
jgi:hypothetical protein